jgi:hypothetical protein
MSKCWTCSLRLRSETSELTSYAVYSILILTCATQQFQSRPLSQGVGGHGERQGFRKNDRQHGVFAPHLARRLREPRALVSPQQADVLEEAALFQNGAVLWTRRRGCRQAAVRHQSRRLASHGLDRPFGDRSRYPCRVRTDYTVLRASADAAHCSSPLIPETFAGMEWYGQVTFDNKSHSPRCYECGLGLGKQNLVACRRCGLGMYCRGAPCRKQAWTNWHRETCARRIV